ncbi:Uu.00g086500.m01.CDS01 [Anthostomella pinea]|uniref:Uu.00g086500.m01.CDS01 n=1 Tax=Anthostomella pinea TaxID=933095 RepID=A0AAI8VM57_9PEZI|nr:Uu.00g086500.m01.CDS01 [Anthostomella pinea]
MTAPPDPSCDCFAATMRVVSQSQPPYLLSSPSTQTGAENNMSLSDSLTIGRNLVQHWEHLNGCANSDAHLVPVVFSLVADATGRVLKLYETAVEELLGTARPPAPQASRLGSLPVPRVRSVENMGSLKPNVAPAFTCELEIDDEEEVAIVYQEALRYSVIRLGAVLQDIEEETRLLDQHALPEFESPLQGRGMKELISRLFCLLGKTHGIGTSSSW